jgi:quercetin dioxygenase-like cupin family protein
MHVAIVDGVNYEPMVGDPDDHRPNTTWALVVDPARDDEPYVAGLTLLFERIAPGDRIPLHTHPIDELLVIDDGAGEARVGDECRRVSAGTAIFVPAGKPHGTRNVGPGTLRLHAVFPTSRIGITYLERNPAPGTEDDPPQPPVIFDARTGAMGAMT